MTAAGGVPIVRVRQDGSPYITDNGNEIIDVKGLKITDPRALEAQIDAWPGVVAVGLFAARERQPARHETASSGSTRCSRDKAASHDDENARDASHAARFLRPRRFPAPVRVF